MPAHTVRSGAIAVHQAIVVVPFDCLDTLPDLEQRVGPRSSHIDDAGIFVGNSGITIRRDQSGLQIAKNPRLLFPVTFCQQPAEVVIRALRRKEFRVEQQQPSVFQFYPLQKSTPLKSQGGQSPDNGRCGHSKNNVSRHYKISVTCPWPGAVCRT